MEHACVACFYAYAARRYILLSAQATVPTALQCSGLGEGCARGLVLGRGAWSMHTLHVSMRMLCAGISC